MGFSVFFSFSPFSLHTCGRRENRKEGKILGVGFFGAACTHGKNGKNRKNGGNGGKDIAVDPVRFL